MRALSEIEIFQDLTRQEMEEMDRTTTMSSCESGRVFYGPDETGEVLFLLKKGKVQLYRLSPEGKKLVVAVLEQGAIFGEMSIIGQGMQNTFAEAIEDCTLCVMSQLDVEQLLVSKPQVGVRILQAMARRLREAEIKLEELAFKSIPARLASLLLKLSLNNMNNSAVKGYTHQDLAEMVGTYRETTTQTLNHFKNQGWIDIERKKIKILDRPALKQLTELS
ncbi:MAG: Crp/Fnr family transcriptional regulator [Chloroflexi bacterium]|nr:Crp/Fnr family transcriptional regulator [Chloroflexota bacterium]